MYSDYLHGMYQPGAEEWMRDKPGWIMFTEAIGYDPNNQSGRDYAQWSDQGFGVIVRLNNGYNPVGTIPEPEHYQEFAQSCANYIAKSSGCSIWIIGNEVNHKQERPHGKVIAPEEYADCFRRCYSAIKAVGQHHSVVSSAIAPWNLESGFWLDYFGRMLKAIPALDGIDIHTYSHGASPATVTSTAKMDEPYQNYYWNFLAYRDFIPKIPAKFFGKPLFLTETNQGDQPWLDELTGWVQEAMQEIHRWNLGPSRNKFACCCLYRYPKHDKWYIEGKEGVLRDFRRAAEHAYPSGMKIETASGGFTTHIPLIHNNSEQDVVPEPDPSVEWDPRLDERNVKIREPKSPIPEGWKWKCIKGVFYDSQESEGRHHIYVDVLDEDGSRMADTPVAIRWDGGEYTGMIEEKPGDEYGFNMPMYAAGSSYRALVNSHISDAVTGMGLGDVDTPHQGDHVSYGLVFRRANVDVRGIEEDSVEEEDPASKPVSEPPKEPDVPASPSIINPRVLSALLAVESGSRPFGPDGRLLIRFEAHIFARTARYPDVDKYFRWQQSRPWVDQQWLDPRENKWQVIHTGRQSSEWDAFKFAQQLDERAAYESISMGVAQIMGFNAHRIGYPSAQTMFKHFSGSHDAQLIGMMNFILSDPALVAAVNSLDWAEIGRKYNGQASAGEKYRAAYQNIAS